MNLLKIEKTPIDNFVINNIYPNARIIKYSELKHINNINELFLNSKVCFILIEFNYNIGHWVLCIKNNDTYEYFDSMGGRPDEIEWIPLNKIKILYGDNEPKYLSNLFYKSNKDIIYNSVKLQSNHTSTCGRFALFRAMCFFNDINLFYFRKILYKIKKNTNLNYDEIISFIIF